MGPHIRTGPVVQFNGCFCSGLISGVITGDPVCFDSWDVVKDSP